VLYRGSCHCGAITFDVEAPEGVECAACNCSMCSLTGFIHLIVPRSKLHPHHPPEALSTYTFNTHVAQHTFCKVCGIKPYYVPRSNPDGFSVNVRCLTPQPSKVTIVPFDGQNWEEHGASLAHLSLEGPS
jgi:hypothetical protein